MNLTKILTTFILLTILAVFVNAQAAPTPVIGKIEINGNSLSGYHIQVKNLDNAEADVIDSDDLSSLITENGLFVFDLGYLGRYEDGSPKYEASSRRYAGDRIEARVVKDGQGNVFSCAQCVYTFNAPRSFPYEFGMKITDSTITIKESCIEIGCSEGYSCNRQTGTCNKVETVIETKTEYVCSDGTKVDKADNCPIETKEHADKIVREIVYVGGAAALGFAGLYLYYRRKKQFARAEKMATTYIKRRKR